MRDRLNRFFVLLKIVFKKDMVILLLEFDNDRKLIDLEDLIFWACGILKKELVKRDIFRNKQ